MPSTVTFVRKAPIAILRRYFAVTDIDLPEVDWSSTTTTMVFDGMKALPRDRYERIAADFDRIAGLSNEAGQNALAAASKGNWPPEGLPSGEARAFSAFLDDPESFRRAEEIRYTDDHRRGKQWDGFKGEAGIEIQRDDTARKAFEQAVRLRFGSQNVHVDVFDRHRRRHRKGDIDLVQATVYLEGLPDQMFAFEHDGQLGLRDYRPVVEASLTYEPATGSIEVVARDTKTREDFVRLFAQDLLGIEIKGERLPFRQFDLETLRRHHSFPTDPEDAIKEVRVTSLRLMPLDDAGQRVTLERLRHEGSSIWAMSQDRFREHDALRGGWRVTQAKFVVKFHRRENEGRGKALPVTITMPHGCDLKDRTERERLVGEKYLERWQLLRNLGDRG